MKQAQWWDYENKRGHTVHEGKYSSSNQDCENKHEHTVYVSKYL